RPEAPARYRISMIERSRRGFRLTMATRMILRNLERQPTRTFISVMGIAFAVAILLVGLSFVDVVNLLMDQQFGLAMLQDATVSFVEPRSVRAQYNVEHLPGVMDLEPMRSVPARLRAGQRTRTVAITGLPTTPRLNGVVDRDGRRLSLPPEGLVMSKILGTVLGGSAGNSVRVGVLGGNRPVRDVPVVSLVDDSIGLQAYMHVDAVRQLLHEGPTLSGAAVTLDSAETARFYARVKLMPAVAGVALREVALQNFRETMAENLQL